MKPDTIRAWERRYGLPLPKRTKGRHRLYSQRDLETIKWLQARLAEGMSISQAVKLWRSLEADDHDPLHIYESKATQETAVSVHGDQIEELRKKWIEAIHQFNEASAERVLTQAFALYPPETVCLQLLMKGLADIGNQWYSGEVTIQQEHFASALAMRRLNTLLAAAPPPTRRERIIIACPPHENHIFAPLLLTLMMRYRSWDVIFLGANVPREGLEKMLNEVHPNLVMLTAQQLQAAASLLEIANFLHSRNISVAFGGLVFNLIPDLQARIPGHFLGERLEEAPHIIENLITLAPKPPEPKPVPPEYGVALTHFRQQQSRIEAHMWQKFNQTEMPYENFVDANQHMANNIVAALTLGDMAYLGTKIIWLEQLLINYRWPPTILQRYLAAYHDAANLYLNGRGRPIVDWLAQFIQPEE